MELQFFCIFYETYKSTLLVLKTALKYSIAVELKPLMVPPQRLAFSRTAGGRGKQDNRRHESAV